MQHLANQAIPLQKRIQVSDASLAYAEALITLLAAKDEHAAESTTASRRELNDAQESADAALGLLTRLAHGIAGL